MSKRKKNKSTRNESDHISERPGGSVPGNDSGHVAEHAVEESRQEAFAARERATRTQISAGQTKVQRLHKGNQPRGR